MSTTLPMVTATISFIRPIVLPSLLTMSQKPNAMFSFLAEPVDYSQYYKDLEREKTQKILTKKEIKLLKKEIKRKKYSAPIEIPDLGPLKPLRQKHSLHSYWRSFRYTIIKEEKDGRNRSELFLLLPLVIRIPLSYLKVNKERYVTNIRVYVFPFGCCCVCMNLRVRGSLDKVINLIKTQLGGTSIMRGPFGKAKDEGTFKKFASSIVININRAMFEQQTRPTITPIHSYTHISTFISEANPQINDLAYHHKAAIAALFEGKSFTEVYPSYPKADIDSILSYKVKEEHTEELLYFSQEGKLSFFYASPVWVHSAEEEQKDKKKHWKGVKCMRNNYESFLILIRSVNAILKDGLPQYKEHIPQERLQQIKNCLIAAFTDTSKIYFKKAFEKFAPIISLTDSLKELGST